MFTRPYFGSMRIHISSIYLAKILVHNADWPVMATSGWCVKPHSAVNLSEPCQAYIEQHFWQRSCINQQLILAANRASTNNSGKCISTVDSANVICTSTSISGRNHASQLILPESQQTTSSFHHHTVASNRWGCHPCAPSERVRRQVWLVLRDA